MGSSLGVTAHIGLNGTWGRKQEQFRRSTNAATDHQLVCDLVHNGMDCMRINCAHDNPKAWLGMIRKPENCLQKKHPIALGNHRCRHGGAGRVCDAEQRCLRRHHRSRAGQYPQADASSPGKKRSMLRQLRLAASF
jgi:hypothetical protein